MAPGPVKQDMEDGKFAKIVKGIEDSFPDPGDIKSDEFKRWACFCVNCSCCHKPDDTFSSGDAQQCLCCKQVDNCVCGKFCVEGYKACGFNVGGGKCFDDRAGGGGWMKPCCISGANCLWCCCATGNSASVCTSDCTPIVLCKARWWCCCFYYGYAIPCDEHVPCELGVCGKMFLEGPLGDMNAKIQACRGKADEVGKKAGDAADGAAKAVSDKSPKNLDANEPANQAAGKARAAVN